ncbi:MAG: C4-type zinc ribbon domain-containing protein [Bacteroidales bacterium]|nr:C4-type zinc ribbon domain-containing protein [Bacteroidales bacterium]MDY6001900.1 C4-type zinc ribbon domain-containing protein [Candidatus Cryptobacteroides sp.]
MATKKIKKVDTPIDQRETFVSLQKNFADSEISVSEKLRTLYQLQQTDSEIDKILQLRGELPSEVESLENDLADLKARQTQLASVIEAYTQTIADNKQNIVDCDNEIEKYKSHLDSVENSREFDSLNKEIENQDLLRQIAIKTINDTKVAIADKKDELAQLKDTISVRSEDLKAKKDELATIEESTADQVKKLTAKREECAKKIDARTMSAYERIRSSVHNHLAVVTVYNGDSCGGCFSTITPQRLIDIASNTKLVICEHCGRIIVNPDFA